MNDKIIKKFMDDPDNASMVLRASFANFIKFFHYYINKSEFIFKDFHYLIIKKLEDIAFGRNEKRNLLINISPRFGKSLIMKYFNAWTYMLNPSAEVIVTSYSDKLAEEFSKEVKGVIATPPFQLFTGIKLKTDSTAANLWKTEDGGVFRAAPMGGSLTGFGAGKAVSDCYGGHIVIDDPQKPSEYRSQTELANTADYYINTVKSRCNDQEKTPIILIMQRLAIEDLTGYIIENESHDWDIIKIPALDEETGKALWEERFPTEKLLQLKEQSPFTYWSQYQQEPIVLGGAVFKAEWWKFYDPKDNHRYHLSWVVADTAQKKDESHDFTVLQYWALTIDKRLHLIDQVRGKFDAKELEEIMVGFWEKWSLGINGCKPYGFYVEDRSSGIGVLQNLRHKHRLPLVPITRRKVQDIHGNWLGADKYSRAMAVLPHIVNGYVHLPNNEKDVISSSIIMEASAFKADLKHKHDDQIDPLMDAVDIAFGNACVGSIFI